jgi:hypothetical protein
MIFSLLRCFGTRREIKRGKATLYAAHSRVQEGFVNEKIL